MRGLSVKEEKQLRKAILIRDNSACTKCGTHVISRGFNERRPSNAVCIHHIDHNTENNITENLTTLCKKCHIEYHTTYRKDNPNNRKAPSQKIPSYGRDLSTIERKKPTGIVIEIEGTNMKKRKVGQQGLNGHIYLPKGWIGKRVVVILTE